MPMRAEFPTATAVSRAELNRPDDVAEAARALAVGAAVGPGFGGFYAITARGDAEGVRRVNQLKGRPLDQVGSIVTTSARMSDVFDWNALPPGLSRPRVLELMSAFYALGPFGFRGPTAAHVPDQLTQPADGVRTTQLIAPGYACASNDFLAQALTATGDDFLYITSANRSHHLTGDPDTPAHWQAVGLRADSAPTPASPCLSTPTRAPPGRVPPAPADVDVHPRLPRPGRAVRRVRGPPLPDPRAARLPARGRRPRRPGRPGLRPDPRPEGAQAPAAARVPGLS
jgi:tRNA A37 threonylcarbamoyladenosine synthetase subunit TsaC/SUA5/YrdC